MSPSPPAGRDEINHTTPVEHPIARGRKARESREDMNPKLYRSSPGTRAGERQPAVWPNGSPSIPEEFVEETTQQGADESDETIMRDDACMVALMRSSTVAQRHGDPGPLDSPSDPQHPVARGRKPRESRETLNGSPSMARPPMTR